MKARRFFLFLFAAGLLASGCTKEYYNDTIVQGLDMTLIDYTGKSNQWNERDGYFEAVLSVPGITKDVVEMGTVTVSRRYNDGGTVWTPLPSMRVEMVTLDDGSDFYYTTFTDFEWYEGGISIFVTTTDLYTGDNPGDISFRVGVFL